MTEHLTAPNAELERLIQRTPKGMMFWAGTCNDASATCGDCDHYGFEIAIRNEAGNAVEFAQAPAQLQALSQAHRPSWSGIRSGNIGVQILSGETAVSDQPEPRPADAGTDNSGGEPVSETIYVMPCTRCGVDHVIDPDQPVNFLCPECQALEDAGPVVEASP